MIKLQFNSVTGQDIQIIYTGHIWQCAVDLKCIDEYDSFEDCITALHDQEIISSERSYELTLKSDM